MASTMNPYCDVSQVAFALNLSPTTLGNDTSWIQELINEAQADIDAELGFSFQMDGTLSTPASRVYDGSDQERLLLLPERIISLSQVLETTYHVLMGSNGVYVQGSTTTTDITADVVLGPPNFGQWGYLFLKRKTGLPFIGGTQNYAVSGVFGRPSIPYDITRACVRLTTHFYKMRATNYSDYIADQGGVKQKYHKTMPEDVMEILDRYRPRLFLTGV